MDQRWSRSSPCGHGAGIMREPPSGNHAGTMWELCGDHAGTMRESCGNHAGTMQEICGDHAGSMRETRGNHAGTMRELCEKHAGNMWEPHGNHAGIMQAPCGKCAGTMRELDRDHAGTGLSLVGPTRLRFSFRAAPLAGASTEGTVDVTLLESKYTSTRVRATYTLRRIGVCVKTAA
eukprot:360831-Chlamydomonas_euryale.AAC.2